MLLINGMPLFHIELKRSNVPLSKAFNQIKKYSDEGIFSGLFSLVQIFIAMTPEDAVYYTNPVLMAILIPISIFIGLIAIMFP